MRLREARRAKGLTLDQLGERVGSSKSYIWQLENKEEASPSGDLLIKLCSALDKNPSYFLSGVAAADDEAVRGQILYRKYSALDAHDQGLIDSIMEVMNAKSRNSK